MEINHDLTNQEQMEIFKKKWANRRKMAYVSLFSMIAATGCLFFLVPESRLSVLADAVTWFYFAMASVIGSYMGFTTWADRKK